MATTIRMKIANGYRPQVDAYVEAHAGASASEAVQRWVQDRYGSWITANVTEAYAFANVSPSQFDVVFDSAEHAAAFQAAIGGQEVADAA